MNGLDAKVLSLLGTARATRRPKTLGLREKRLRRIRSELRLIEASIEMFHGKNLRKSAH